MKKTILLMIPCVSLLFGGCACINTSKADLNKAPKGVRVYPPAVYLFVDKAKGSQYLTAPDYSKAYDIRPFTFLAKNSFSLELSDGVLSKYTGDQDTSGFIALLSTVGQSAAKAAGAAVSQQSMAGSFGLADGIYKLNPETQKFEKITP
jgi:hypothetical protein